jgi:iron complex outermembrane recepter protein
MSYLRASCGCAGLGVIAWSLASATFGTAAAAQPSGNADSEKSVQGDLPGNPLDEIIVTARKRDETLISSPVVESAINETELRRRAINDFDSLSSIVPQLIIAPAAGSVQGGVIAMRGISSPEVNPFSDQAVAFNIDGVQVAKASVRRLSDSDISQVEVLKGPQALFFGKNSPAGVISIKTSDPTDQLQAGISTGYDFYAQETRTDAYVSGPIDDDLEGRIAGYYSHMNGWLTDETPQSSPYFDTARDPGATEFGVRGTLKWAPTSSLDVKFKLNYGEINNKVGGAATEEYINCGLGHRQSGSGAQCSPGDNVVNTGIGSVIGTIPGTLNNYGDGQPFLHQQQLLSSLEINYDFNHPLLLTAVSGVYYSNATQMQNLYNDYAVLLPNTDPYRDLELSQEVRVTSDFKGPLNFATGIYVADTHTQTGGLTYAFGANFPLFGPGGGGPTTPFLVNDYFLKQDGQAYSGYLQLIYKPIDVLEIDVGGRYSYEHKSLPLVETSTTALLTSASVINTPVNQLSFHDFSPEFTVAYRPSNDLTVFGSRKHGFLSGGFNSAANDLAANPRLNYLPETIQGEEIGVKAALLNGTLRLNAAGYYYDVTGFQVSNYIGTVSVLSNASAVNIKGLEGDVTYHTPINGLIARGAFAYNDGTYTSFKGAPCWTGQTPSQGCAITNGVPGQNLSGSQLLRAPKENLSGGLSYERGVGQGLKLGLSADISYSSSYFTNEASDPNAREPSYTLVDSTLRLTTEDGRWEGALIGRNLTDRHYWDAAYEVPFTGSGTGTPAGVRGDTYAALNRGRELFLRVSYKF